MPSRRRCKKRGKTRSSKKKIKQPIANLKSTKLQAKRVQHLSTRDCSNFKQKWKTKRKLKFKKRRKLKTKRSLTVASPFTKHFQKCTHLKR